MNPSPRIVTPAASDYSAGAIVGRFARAIGIVLIFSIVGPLTIAALISLIVVAFGAALLQMFLALLELDALRTVISVAVGLLAFVTALASFLPSVSRADIRAGCSLWRHQYDLDGVAGRGHCRRRLRRVRHVRRALGIIGRDFAGCPVCARRPYSLRDARCPCDRADVPVLVAREAVASW
ncbi:hypothetical protein [Bradyrhizobium algeriense]|uniref:hypothetical protein n=1 Tax=Bradyrhizobium algeriense TaxID=634784 RepID=UPI001FCE6FBE|nr:hypothetical protein [Bradyrhizobium algeriense]